METGSGERDPGIFGISDNGPLTHVREGMQVVDATGEEIGTVEIVKMGDPTAATVGADADRDGGMLQDFAQVFGFDPEPEVPAVLRARMMRLGFLKIDSSGLFATSRYVTADKVASVSGDTVTLSVAKDQIAEED